MVITRLSHLFRSPVLGFAMVKRIVVTLDDGQYMVLQGFKGLGESDGEKLKTIFLSYMYQKNVPKIECKEEKDPDFV